MILELRKKKGSPEKIIESHKTDWEANVDRSKRKIAKDCPGDEKKNYRTHQRAKGGKKSQKVHKGDNLVRET